MIGPIEKSQTLDSFSLENDSFNGTRDLSYLPKYICYKAALLKEKIVWMRVALFQGGLMLILAIFSGVTITDLNQKLREKEYISLPDFIPVSPQSISDEEVKGFVEWFLTMFQNVNSRNIRKNYLQLMEVMSPELQMKFELEMEDLIESVKEEKITEISDCPTIEVIEENGFYKVTSLCKVQTFFGQDFGKEVDRIIEMEVKLLPPKKGRKVLQVFKLSKSTQESFKKPSK